MKATAAGKKFIPSLGDKYLSNRPVNLNALVAPWEAAEIFAERGNFVDPRSSSQHEDEGLPSHHQSVKNRGYG